MVTYTAYLKERLRIYDVLLAEWLAAVDETPELAPDIADLADYRRVIHERYEIGLT